jgi:hypothetical protein
MESELEQRDFGAIIVRHKDVYEVKISRRDLCQTEQTLLVTTEIGNSGTRTWLTVLCYFSGQIFFKLSQFGM